MKKKLIIIIGILVLCSGMLMLGYIFRFRFYEWQKNLAVAKLPPAIDATAVKKRAELPRNNDKPLSSSPLQPSNPPLVETPPQSPPVLPQEINLAVPFTPQAPYAIWDEYHNDACEEASVLMVARFWQHKPFTGAADAEAELLAIKNFEDRVFGYNKDTGVDMTARILKEYYKFPLVEVRYDISIEDLKNEVLSGRPVIVPVKGQLLKNPFFKPPGPPYHMLVVKGVTADGKFVTNDPGTKRGADFIYGQELLYNAINNWDDKLHVISGRKAMIVVH